jgi:hypothetical protein
MRWPREFVRAFHAEAKRSPVVSLAWVAMAAALLACVHVRAAHAATQIALIASNPPSLCGGASLELERELVAAGFDTLRVPRSAATTSSGFDASLWFSESGDQIRLFDHTTPDREGEVASLRVDCSNRLVRRRVWTLVVEMLWARRDGQGAQVENTHQADTESRPQSLTVKEVEPPAPYVPLSPVPTGVYAFGAGAVVGANAFATAPAWDLALLGGYRSPSGYRLGGRLRWPVTVASESTQRGSTRMWTFTGDVEAAKVFRRPTSVVQPFVGATLGLHFTLLDTSGVNPWLDRRWAALHGRALGHVGLGLLLAPYTFFCQLEAGLARRLQADDEVQPLDRGGNAFVAAVSLGVAFDY